MSEDEKEPEAPAAKDDAKESAKDDADAKEAAKEATPAPEAAAKRPSSPWPSSRKSEAPKAEATAPAADAPAPAAADDHKAAWAAPLDRFDRAWTRLDARLCAIVLIADAMTLVFWISLKAMSNTGTSGPGRVFRCLIVALILGIAAHFLTRRRTPRHEQITTAAVVAGLLVGSQLGDAGVAYFGNMLSWLQNASFLVFFGGASDVAKRLTLWLALLGASVATGQGKHINVDVVMRFLSPRARVPVAVLGWVVAAAVCFVGIWGFFDHVAVVDYRAPVTVACAGDETKQCPAPPSSKIDFVLTNTRRDLFLLGRQVSLDLRTFPDVLAGKDYGKSLSAKDWNTWLRDGGWEKYFTPEQVKGMELSEDEKDSYRTPAVTAIPGTGERVFQLLVRECNFVFAFGLLVISIRFILRSLLAIAGWVKVDPNAAHGDEGLAEAHDHTGNAKLIEDAIKETAR